MRLERPILLRSDNQRQSLVRRDFTARIAVILMANPMGSQGSRMRRTFFRRAILLLCLSMLLLATALRARTKEEPAPPKTLEELQKAIKNELERNHVPGAGVALVSRGEVLWCGGIGDADLASKRPVTCDTEFRVGSISKTFVALALLKLQEEGKINLEARLHDVAPEIPMSNAWEAAPSGAHREFARAHRRLRRHGAG